MHIPDLTQLPAGHPPSPYPFPVPLQRRGRWGTGALPAPEPALIAVGWLGDRAEPAGETPADVVDALIRAYRKKWIIYDGTAGWHDCEICTGFDQRYPGGQVGPIIKWGLRRLRIRAYGHFLVRLDERVYMAPALLPHYILDHRYRPPDEFLQAVREGTFLKPEDLLWVEPPEG